MVMEYGKQNSFRLMNLARQHTAEMRYWLLLGFIVFFLFLLLLKHLFTVCMCHFLSIRINQQQQKKTNHLLVVWCGSESTHTGLSGCKCCANYSYVVSNSAIQIAIATASPAQIASFYVSSFHSIIICFFNGQLRLFSFYLCAFSIRFFAFLCNFSHPTVKKKCNLDCGLDCNRKLRNYTKKKRRIIGLAKSFFFAPLFSIGLRKMGLYKYCK